MSTEAKAPKEPKEVKEVKEPKEVKESTSLKPPEAKIKAAQLAMEQIEKAFGKGSIMRLSDESSVDIESISTGCLSLDAAIGRSNTTVIFTNQLRSKIGVVYGNPETTTGGNALKYYASVRIDVRRKDVIKDGQEIVGNRVRAKIVKNKVAPPFREAEFDIMYNEGISRLGDMIDVAVESGIIVKSGSWFSFNDERVQGRDGMRKLLTENAPLYAALESVVREALHLPTPGVVPNKKK